MVFPHKGRSFQSAPSDFAVVCAGLIEQNRLANCTGSTSSQSVDYMKINFYFLYIRCFYIPVFIVQNVIFRIRRRIYGCFHTCLMLPLSLIQRLFCGGCFYISFQVFSFSSILFVLLLQRPFFQQFFTTGIEAFIRLDSTKYNVFLSGESTI